MRRLVLLATLIAAPALASAAPVAWVLDRAHTQTSFEVSHLNLSTYRGEFTRADGTVVLDEDHPGASRVEATIDAASIRTREPAWDARLRSPEFLDADQHPTIRFRSTAVVRAAVRVEGRDDELGQYRVEGLLTLHGVTRSIVLEATLTPAVTDAEGRLRRGIRVQGYLNRQDFGIRWSRAIEAGPLISDEVAIHIDGEVFEAPALLPSSGALR